MKNRIRNQILSFAQLKDAVDEIWNKGYVEGEEYKASHLSYNTVEESLDVDENDSVSVDYTFTDAGTVYVKWRLHGSSRYRYISKAGGGRIDCSENWGASYSVSAGDSIHINQDSAMTTNPDQDGFVLVVYYN